MEMMGKKILLLCTGSQEVIAFRTDLIKQMQKSGCEISVVTFDDVRKADIEMLGVKCFSLKQSNRGLNPFKIFSLKNAYKKIIANINPDIVFTFQLKPNTIGVLAAKSLKIEYVYSMVEGAGDVFINNGIRWKIIRSVVCSLYKKAFRNVRKIFFLNNEDKNEFIDKKLVCSDKCEIIKGIGVNLERFAYKEIKENKNFLMIARMLKTKGIYEYCKCARVVKQKYPDATFSYLGAEGTVKVADIQEYIDDGSIEYLGTTKDVRPYIENAQAMLLLSSYREGLPMSIMEAQAVGRAIITSNGVGCKDTVVEGYNGFMVNQHDYEKMAEKVIWCIEHPIETAEMGKNARIFAEKFFDSNKINQKVCEVIGL